MRIFNKMKKMLLVAAALFAVNVAFAESKTVNYIQNDTDNLPGTETVNVSLDAISFSYLGDAGGWDVKSNKQSYSGNSYTNYVSGKSNPTVTDGVPTAGSVMGFVPQYDGQIALCMVVNGNKATYVLEDGVGLASFDVDGKWNEDGSAADVTIASGEKLQDKCYGTITFSVKANKQYYVYCTGSKMGYYGFSYTYDDAPASSGPDFTACNEAIDWANAEKAKLNAEDEAEAMVITEIDNAVMSLQGMMTDPEAISEYTQEDWDLMASMLKEQIQGYIDMIPALKLQPVAEQLQEEGWALYDSYAEDIRTDEAGLAAALQALRRAVTQENIDAVNAAMAAFKTENDANVAAGGGGSEDPETPATVDLIAPDQGVNVLEVGKTYVLTAAATQYQVSFTAEKDGFLTITPSRSIRSTGFKINNASSTFTKNANGGFDKKGIAAGSVFTGKFYYTGEAAEGEVISFTVTFEEGVPYSPLALTEAAPKDGEVWSGAAIYYTTYASYMGQPYFNFSSAINTTDVAASVKIGEEVIAVTTNSAKNGVVLKGLPEVMNVAIAAGKIKAGDTFTVTLSNIKDKEFSANALADLVYTYTLASTACTGAASDASTSKLPTYVTFSFDGNVNIDAAKFYYVNMFTEETIELTGEVVEGTSVKVAGPAIEGLPSRQYKIVAENVTDADGKAISYSSDEKTYPVEEGKLIFTKALNNSPFNNPVATVSLDNWSEGYTQVYSLKSFSITWPAPVVLDETVTAPVVFTKESEQEDSGDIGWWSEGGESEGGEGEATETEITVSHAISETDPCTVIFTLSQEVTELGKYSIEMPSKLYWAKDYYTPGDDAKNNSFGYFTPSKYAWVEIIEPMMTDVTDKLVNPGFEASATEGWTAGSKGTQYGTSGDAQKLKDGQMFAGNIVEHWEGSAWTGDIAQTVNGLPAGLYKFTFCAYVNNAGEAYVFANDALSANIESGKVGEYTVFTYLEEGAALKVGFKNVSGINWICLDNAHLYYYGNCPMELVPTAELNGSKAIVNELLQKVEELKAAYANPIEVEALDAAVAAVKTETIEECTASIAALNDAMAAFKAVNDAEIAFQELAATLEGATAEAPVDATGFIKNASFAGGSYNCDNGTGGGNLNAPENWTVTYTNADWGWKNFQPATGGGQDGEQFFEFWAATYHTLTLGQEVRLPAGSYVVSAALRTEKADQVTSQHVYVKIGEDVDSSAILGAPIGDSWNAVNAWQTLSVSFSVEKESVVTIGAGSTGGANSAGWFQIDNFRLSCTGLIDPALAPAVDSLKALIVEATELKASLSAADEAHAQVIGMIDQMIPAAQAVVDAPESTAAVNEMISSVYMFLYQTKIQLAQYDAQMAQALMGTYENPTDEAGFEAAITQVFVISNGLMMGEAYTLGQLEEAVAAMKAAQEAFIAENTPAVEQKTFWDFAALFAQYGNKVVMTYSSDVVKVGGTDCNVGTEEYAGLAAQGADKWILYNTGGLYNLNSGDRKIGVLDLTIGKIVTVVAAGEVLTLADETVAKQNSMTTADGLTTYVYEMTADGHLALTTKRNGTIVSIKVEEPAAAPRFDLTSYEAAVAAAEAFKATLNAEDESENEVIMAVNDYMQSAADWLAEIMEDPEATQEDVESVATDLNASVEYLKSSVEVVKIWPEVEAAREEGTNLLLLYPDELRTDEAGLSMAMRNLPMMARGQTVESLRAAIDAVKATIVPFQQENNQNVADSANVAVAGAEGVLAQYPNATDDAGLAAAIEAVKTIVAANETTSTEYPVADLLAALETLAAAQATFVEDTQYVKSDLTKEMFLNWDGVGADAQPTAEATYPEYNVGVEIGAGGMLYGYSTVYYLSYADLTGYTKMIIEGTPGMQFRVLMNRVENEGALTEVNVTIGEDGKAVVDFAGMEYVHLNAIKAGWGSAAGTVTKVTLVKPYVEEVPEGPTVAYLCGATETTEDIYTALVAAGYNVTPLNYDEVSLTEEIVANDFVGKYDVVVLAGATGSTTNLAKTANLLVGKVNVLSTKSFWYKHYGTNGENPGTAAAPSLSLTKSAAFVEHPIYAGIEGDEFAVFNDMAKENGRYLQSNGSFAEGPEQVTLGTTLGADCIGEAWSNGFGYVIVPVDGAQPEGYLTEDGKALFVNIVEYLINGEQYVSGIADVTINGAQWPADIYDVNGRMVKKAATSLEGLQKGLYFVNGKKMLVK